MLSSDEQCEQCGGSGVGAMVWVGPGKHDWRFEECSKCGGRS